MSYNTNRVAGFTAETTRGTAIAVVFNVDTYNATPISPSVTTSNQGVLSGHKTTAPHEYIGTREGTVTFDVDFAGSGDNAVAPKVAELFVAGGFLAVDGTPDKYTMDGTLPCSSLSYEAYNYECGNTPAGTRSLLTGAVPVLTIGADTVGSLIKVNASLTGSLQEDLDVAAGAPKVVTGNDTEKGLIFKGGAYDIGGTAVSLKSFSFTTGAEVAMESDSTDADTGIAWHFIKSLAGRQLTMEFTKLPKATYDAMGDYLSEVINSAITISFNNTTTGQVGKFVFKLAQAIELSENDADAYLTQSVTYRVEDVDLVFDSIA